MKKTVVAGIALLLVGTAAFAAVRIGVYGVCPLTGRPIHHSAIVCPPTPECPFDDQRCSESGAFAANAAADATTAPQADAATPCAQTRRHCCHHEAQAECPPAAAPAPAPEPSTRP